MMSGAPQARMIFEKDVEDTYKHLVERVRISKAEEAAAAEAGAEQIQLVPENPSQTIGFNVPDGPPAERIELQGEALEGVDPEDVRKALQMRWDVFQGFAPEMQAALRSQSLDSVNRVLGKMKVEDAEELVKMLDLAGILSFSEHGVRDETGKSKAAQDEADEDEEEEEDVDEVD
jgi:cell division cycle protein 37